MAESAKQTLRLLESDSMIESASLREAAEDTDFWTREEPWLLLFQMK